jgi:hypothetical protein
VLAQEAISKEEYVSAGAFFDSPLHGARARGLDCCSGRRPNTHQRLYFDQKICALFCFSHFCFGKPPVWRLSVLLDSLL